MLLPWRLSVMRDDAARCQKEPLSQKFHRSGGFNARTGSRHVPSSTEATAAGTSSSLPPNAPFSISAPVQLHKLATSPRTRLICFKKSAIASHCFSIKACHRWFCAHTPSPSARARYPVPPRKSASLNLVRRHGDASHRRRAPTVSGFIWAMQSWAMWLRLIA